MTRTAIVWGGCAALLAALFVVAGNHGAHRGVGAAAAKALATSASARSSTRPSTTPSTTSSTTPSISPSAASSDQGFLYGRITAVDGAAYEGRLRWGGDEESFWDDYFNGFKPGNPWLVHVPPELQRKKLPIELFGMRIGDRTTPIDFGRPLMVRFGDIARFEAIGRRVRVTLKSGTLYEVDRFEASDFDDGVRVWDDRRGVVDLESPRIRAIELLPTAPLEAAPVRLKGTVRTRQGDFAGFIEWNRKRCVGTDELEGRTADGELRIRFNRLRSIARRSGASSLVTLLDGREIVLSGSGDVGDDNRGIAVVDRRYGRVMIAWDAFESVDFGPPGHGGMGDIGGSGPAYDDFQPALPLSGSIVTRDGRRRAGRLVYDLDESNTLDTLDARFQGLEYTIPFGMVASILPSVREASGAFHAAVTLHDGEELRLERAGDLGEGNAGLLIFVEGVERPEYVPWSDVERADFDGPPATDLRPGGR